MSTVRNTYFGGIVTNGMTLCLDAAKKDSYPGNGVIWNDLTTNDHICTLIGNTTYSNSFYGEFTLDGTGDYLTIPQAYGDFSNPVCSFEIWCYPTSFPSNGQIIFMDRPTFGSQAYGVEIFVLDATGKVGVRGSSATRVDSTGTLNINEWNHIIVNCSGTTAECYINNVYESLGTITQVATSAYPMYIGKYPTITNTYDWNGKISVVRTYNKALSSNEVTKNYDALKGRFGLT